jgi:hypothetical protein
MAKDDEREISSGVPADLPLTQQALLGGIASLSPGGANPRDVALLERDSDELVGR